ncbi:hypothetical protein CCP2SC5_470013 [Azospirillaceae bacterium]
MIPSDQELSPWTLLILIKISWRHFLPRIGRKYPQQKQFLGYCWILLTVL